MGQKSNLITVRRKNFINIYSNNSKVWVSFLKFMENFNYFLSKKKILICDHFLGIENNCGFLELHLFYQQAKLDLYNRKKKKIKQTVKKIFELKRKNFFTKILRRLALYNVNSYLIKLQTLNKFVERNFTYRFYIKVKKYQRSVFSRRFSFFCDFLKLTILFLFCKIPIKQYLKSLGSILKTLSKKVHNKFIYFIKSVFEFLISLPEAKKTLQKNLLLHPIAGLKLVLNGKFRGKDRSSTKIIEVGQVSTQSILKDISFSTVHVYTVYGAFGLNLWVHRKKL